MRRLGTGFLLFFFACLDLPLYAERVKLTVLATTDMHGNLYPVDYYNDDKPANRGLVKIATLIRSARADNPNNLLIDCGDTIQGTRSNTSTRPMCAPAVCP